MTTTQIYNLSAYTKTGKLKKNAKCENSFTIGGDGNTTDESRKINTEHVAKRIKELGYHNFRSPYVFTFIHAMNDKNEEVYIHQSVVIGIDQREVTVSPIALFKELTK